MSKEVEKVRLMVRFVGVFLVLFLVGIIKRGGSSCLAPDPRLKNDIGSALAWGTFDTCFGSDGPQYQSETKNATTLLADIESSLSVNETEKILKRKKRIVYISNTPFLSGELRYVFPLAPINRELKTFINIEFPINYFISFPYFEYNVARSFAEESSSLFLSVEELLSSFGFDGRSCVLRSLCEVSSLSPVKPRGILKDVLSIAVKYMFQSANETEDHEVNSSAFYLEAASKGRAGANCAYLYPECPISVLGLVQRANEG